MTTVLPGSTYGAQGGTTLGGTLWTSVAYGAGLFVAFPLFSATNLNCSGGWCTYGLMTSPDGLVWTLRGRPDGNFVSLIFANNKFAAAGMMGSAVNNNLVAVFMSSADGIAWVRVNITMPTGADTIPSVSWGNNVYIVLAYGSTQASGQSLAVGTGWVLRSTDDGATWTGRDAVAKNKWRSVAFGNNMFVAVSTITYNQNDNSTRSMTSSDFGVTWIAGGPMAGFTYPSSIIWSTSANEFIVTVNGGYNGVITSTNGASWTAPAGGNNWGQWLSIADNGNNQIIAVATGNNPRGSNTTRIMSSP